MSEDQFPTNQDMPKQDPQPGQNPQSNPNPFQPQNGGFPPSNGGMGFNGMQVSLPNSTIVLVLGILSILTCCCYGIIGVILAIVALVLSKKDKALYEMNIGAYTESSFKNLNAGRVCAIIGLILSVLYLIMVIIVVIMFGFGAMSNQEALREALQNMR